MFFNRLANVVFTRPSRSNQPQSSEQTSKDNSSPQNLASAGYRGKMMDWFGWDA